MRKLFSGLTAFAAVMMTSMVAMAEGGEAAAAGGDKGMMALAIAIGIGLAASLGAYSQGKTASAALEGIARNPNAADKVFVPMILGLAFIESLVLFTWVLMFLMQGKI